MELHITAFMVDPDVPRPDNPIHSTEGGRAYGFRAALVGGVDVYGWSTRLIRQVLGDQWLRNGWTDVQFRRPVYPGDQLVVRLLPQAAGAFTLEMSNQTGENCLQGSCGLSAAAWLSDLKETGFAQAQSRADPLPTLTFDSAPVGLPLRAMPVTLSIEDCLEHTRSKQAEDGPLFLGPNPLVHPSLMAGLMIKLLHHSYAYGPAIHTRSQIQHLAEARAGIPMIVTGCCREVYERNGHYYIVNDGSIWTGEQQELARIRHTAIFVVACGENQLKGS